MTLNDDDDTMLQGTYGRSLLDGGPAMITRPRTSDLRMPSTHPPSGTPIIGSNTVGSCP